MTRPLVLITGASAGIGAEFARQYAARGWDVALTARRADRLEALAREVQDTQRITALTIQADLADPQAPDAILGAITARGRRVDGLVNNAGYGLPGTFLNTRWQDQAEFLQVLLTAPLALTHKVLPSMAERRFGRIINVASLAGYAPGSKGHTLYGAVKAALIKASESLHSECDGLNVHVTALCPGFTFSEFHDVNGTREATKTMPSWMWMQAAPVVAAGIAAVEKGQPVVVPGAVNKGLATLTRILPEPLGRAIARGQTARYRSTDPGSMTDRGKP
jgi:short-subunit dehydrogenase